MLQYYCKKLGEISDQSHVAHCKIVGEEIKFDWGFFKMMFRSKPLALKRIKMKFHELVMLVLNSGTLTLFVCRSNACRAKQYMLAYMVLSKTGKKHENPIQHTNNKEHAQDDQQTNKQEETKPNNNTITH